MSTMKQYMMALIVRAACQLDPGSATGFGAVVVGFGIDCGLCVVDQQRCPPTQHMERQRTQPAAVGGRGPHIRAGALRGILRFDPVDPGPPRPRCSGAPGKVFESKGIDRCTLFADAARAEQWPDSRDPMQHFIHTVIPLLLIFWVMGWRLIGRLGD